jgi:hypothetical protein|nr:MAG TPA: hypothetical protein [Caudoviricetes sp.]
MEGFKEKYKKIGKLTLVSIGVLGVIIIWTVCVKLTEFSDLVGVLGSLVGVIIGGTITFGSVGITLEESYNNRKKDKIDEIRPFLVLEATHISSLEGDKVKAENRKKPQDSRCIDEQRLGVTIKNVGLDSAVNIKCNGEYLAAAIEKGEKLEKGINYTYNKGEQDNNEIYLRFTFNDLRENQYEQEMIFELEKNERSEFNEKGVQKSPKLIQE